MRTITLICLISPMQLFAMMDSVMLENYYEPYPLAPGSLVVQLGGSLTVLPTAVVENEYPAPAFDAQLRAGLSSQWSFAASLSTNFFSNVLHFGPQWNTNFNDLSVGVAVNMGGFLGYFTAEGQFDKTWAYAVFTLPMARVGYRIGEYAISTSVGAAYILASETKTSDISVDGPTNTINDFFCTLAVEQPFLKSAEIALGISLSYSRTPFQTWMLYNTIDEFLFLPEFFMAVKL